MNRSTKFLAATALAVVATVSVSLPVPAQAAALTTAQIQSVVSLLQAFGVDSTTITNVEQTLGGATTDTANASTTAVSSSMIGFLRLGNEGDAVKLLQILLAADPSIYPEGIVSGYFGQLTQKALKQYQKKHGLEQVGFIGPRTLKNLEDDLDENGIASEDDSSNRGRGHRFCAIVPPGHLVAPGWLRKNGGTAPLIPTCQKLPPGIAAKLSATTTTSNSDKTAPALSSVDATAITNTAATITWTTNESATGLVSFGTTTAYGMSASTGSTRSTSHSIMLTGLTASTQYHFRVTSTDASGNTATSSDEDFTTLATADTTAPVISDVETHSVAATTAEIRWDTDEDATSKVYYATTTPVSVATASLASSNTLEDSHEINLSGLTASTTYYYFVVSADAANNAATSSQVSFETLAS